MVKPSTVSATPKYVIAGLLVQSDLEIDNILASYYTENFIIDALVAVVVDDNFTTDIVGKLLAWKARFPVLIGQTSPLMDDSWSLLLVTAKSLAQTQGWPLADCHLLALEEEKYVAARSFDKSILKADRYGIHVISQFFFICNR